MSSPRPTPEPLWHDVECGAYSEDLPLWEELAASHGEPILEVGAGTGRVALHLARRGFAVDAIDLEPDFAAALESRARHEGLPVRSRVGDVRTSEPAGPPYSLVIAAMQLVQLMDGSAGRAAALERIARCLAPGGLVALAIVEGHDGVVGTAEGGMLPDVRERDGWVHSSLPLDVVARNGHLEVRRLRQTVSPEGALEETEHLDVLDVLDAATVEAEAAAAGLTAAGRRPIAQSELHVGSTVVLLRRGA